MKAATLFKRSQIHVSGAGDCDDVGSKPRLVCIRLLFSSTDFWGTGDEGHQVPAFSE